MEVQDVISTDLIFIKPLINRVADSISMTI